MKMNDKTIDYYNANARKFAENTAEIDFSSVQDRFLSYIPAGGRILDFGCGSGRDSKYFLSKGFGIDAVDGSEELCGIASQYVEMNVKQMLFSELEAVAAYDGIWACASILHLSKDELTDVFFKMCRALKDKGYIYTSFKYGIFEGYRNDRFFTDFTEDSFNEFLREIPYVQIMESWISADIRQGRSDEKWLNLILQKSVPV